MILVVHTKWTESNPPLRALGAITSNTRQVDKGR